MKVKTFRAATLREALDQVRAEMGPEAFILASRELKERGALGMFSRSVYEVAAAIEQSERPKAGRQLNLQEESPALPHRKEVGPSQPKTILSLRDVVPPLQTTTTKPSPSQRGPQQERGSTAEPESERSACELQIANCEFGSSIRNSQSAIRNTNDSPLPPSRPPIPNSNRDNSGWEREALLKAFRAPGNTTASELTQIQRELRELKLAVGSLMHAQLQSATRRACSSAREATPAHAEVLRELEISGVEEWLIGELAQALARYPQLTERCAITEVLTASIRKLVRLAPAEEVTGLRPHTAVFVGPTGIGKTTTLAKVSAQVALARHCPVELITTDTYRIAAIEQLRTYAELIGVPFHVARDARELASLLARIGKDKLVLIDTAGCNQHDLSEQLELAEYLRRDRSLVKHLVISATTKPDDTRMAIEKFSLYGINRLVFTKLDETCTHGVILNEAARTGLPVSYLANGQRVPEALLPVSPDLLTRLILRSTVVSCQQSLGK